MILPSELAPPATDTVGYFETPAPVFADWLAAVFGPSWTPRACPPGTLEELVALVRPRVPLSRHLLLPNRGWTVLLNDGPLGTDPGALLWHAPKDLGCRAVRATVLPAHRPYPATILQVHDPSAVDDPLFSRRTITAANDGGKWVFSETGERFPFEETEAYRRRLVRDRFTPQMLARYLAALGVPADEKPDTASAILVEER